MIPGRHDYYQTETLVAVSIFSKGVTEDKLTVSIGERSVRAIQFRSSDI